MKTFLKNQEAQKQLKYYITDQFKTNQLYKVISDFNFFLLVPRQNLYIAAIKQRLVFVCKVKRCFKKFCSPDQSEKDTPLEGRCLNQLW